MSYISIMISKIYLIASLLLSWFILSFSIPDAIHSNHKDPMTVALSILIILMAAGLWDSGPCTKSIQPGNRGTPIKRCRRSVDSIMYELGGYSRRYYRMENDTFWKLHGLLHQKIDNPSGETKEKRGGPPNGTIPSSIRLSCALRYFAGGDALDLAVVHGISHSEVLKSVWLVIDAIHHTPDLDICFPRCHDEQCNIAREFQSKSTIGFDCCVGAVDGILIWMNRPSKTECDLISIGQMKFLCG